MFSIKKCDNVSCTVCLPPRLPHSIFSTLHRLPDPIPNGEHYKTFEDSYGTETSECHMPSLCEKENKGHKIPFSPSAKTAKTTSAFLICEECRKPRLLHSQKKLKRDEGIRLETILEQFEYSCGADIHDIDIDEPDALLLSKVFVK